MDASARAARSSSAALPPSRARMRSTKAAMPACACGVRAQLSRHHPNTRTGLPACAHGCGARQQTRTRRACSSSMRARRHSLSRCAVSNGPSAAAAAPCAAASPASAAASCASAAELARPSACGVRGVRTGRAWTGRAWRGARALTAAAGGRQARSAYAAVPVRKPPRTRSARFASSRWRSATRASCAARRPAAAPREAAAAAARRPSAAARPCRRAASSSVNAVARSLAEAAASADMPGAARPSCARARRCVSSGTSGSVTASIIWCSASRAGAH